MTGRLFRGGRHRVRGGQGQATPVAEIADRIGSEFIPTSWSAGPWRIVRQGYDGPEYYEMKGTFVVPPAPDSPAWVIR